MNQEPNKDYMLPQAALDYILRNFPTDSKILEFGSGHGSRLLAKEGFDITCVEHNPKWQDLFPEIKYINAEIKDAWYDVPKIDFLPYKLIIVDGPPQCHGDRRGFLKAFHPPFLSQYILVDDVNRKDGREIMLELCERYKHSIELVFTGERISAFIYLKTTLS